MSLSQRDFDFWVGEDSPFAAMCSPAAARIRRYPLDDISLWVGVIKMGRHRLLQVRRGLRLLGAVSAALRAGR